MTKGKKKGNKSDNGIREKDAKRRQIVSDNPRNLRFQDEYGWKGWMRRAVFLCAEGFEMINCPCKYWRKCDAYPSGQDPETQVTQVSENLGYPKQEGAK